MNVTTSVKVLKDGGKRVTASGGGKQKTIPFNHKRTEAQNHGDAAGELLKPLVRVDRRWFLMATAKDEVLPDGRHRFTVRV